MAETALALAQLRDSPALRQMLSLFGVAAAVAIGVALFMWSQQPGYVPLYTGLSEGDAAEVSEALRASGIDFRLEPGTGALLVPSAKVHAARLDLASQGLPRSSGTGFEMIREEPGLGVSQFMESARYQHALETELSRTVVSLQPIKNARVHLALPRPSAFARSRRQASASVLVAMHPGRRLEAGQVAAIVNLVASSIPNLESSQVTVIDQAGRLLSEPEQNDEMALSANQFNLVKQIEDRYVARIEELLLPISGPGRINAQVSVDMDFTASEETRETYEPGNSAVRSEQLAEESLVDGIGGVPGAVSNRPPATRSDPVDAGAEQSLKSRQSTRNYEIDRTISRTRQTPGRIRRVTAAVLIDHMPAVAESAGAGGADARALDAEELGRIEALVKEAIGFDAARGDSVNVQSVSFFQQEIPVLDEPPLWEQPTILNLLRHLLGAALVLIVALVVLRPALRAALQPHSSGLLAGPVAAPVKTSSAGATGALAPVGEAEPGERLQADESPPKTAPGDLFTSAKKAAFDDRLNAVRTAVGEDPKRVAQVMRTWLGDE